MLSVVDEDICICPDGMGDELGVDMLAIWLEISTPAEFVQGLDGGSDAIDLH